MTNTYKIATLIEEFIGDFEKELKRRKFQLFIMNKFYSKYITCYGICLPMRKVMLSSLTATILLTTFLASPNLVLGDAGDSISICCAWNDKLSDGILTYRISGGDDAAKLAVRDAVEEWDTELTGLQLDEITGKTKGDIEIHFKKGGGMIAGQALRNFDANGFMTSVRIQISGSAFGTANNVVIVEQVVKHEFAHALGIGHANFAGDLMSTTVQSGTGTISTCDINSVIAANHWKMVDSATSPHAPHVNHMHC
jgi:hypothetical protein